MSETTTFTGPRGGIRWDALQKAMVAKDYDPSKDGVEKLAADLSTDEEVIAVRTVWSWLRGQREPTLAGMERLTKTLDVTADYLMRGRPKKIYQD